MKPLDYALALDAARAVELAGAGEGHVFIAGGTDLVQLMEEGVLRPERLIDIRGLALAEVEASGTEIRIGALASLADVAAHPGLAERAPVIAEALLASASPQVRNMATIGGNLLQRTRCLYFRDAAMPCNKRVPGTGCPAQDGANRMNAILGGSEHCIAAHASDLAVSLVALDADISLRGPGGARRVKLAELYRLPGETPHIETVLEPGELIEAVHVPAGQAAARSHYLKVRDRASFEWAVTSAAVALDVADGMVRTVRVAAGGVGTVPWRLSAVEDALTGGPLDPRRVRQAAEWASEGAAPRGENAFKTPLLVSTVERAILELAGLA